MKKDSKTPKSFRFKRWNRAGFSAFASMHRHVTIGRLAVGMFILALPARTASAQQHDGRAEIREKLDSASVWTEKSSPTRTVMAKTAIFNRSASHQAPFQTLESVLRVSPAIDVRERAGKAIQTDISIRGGSFDQTQVMLNGINFTDARTGHQTHSLPIDIDCISSVELLDGVQGVGAYAGAINFKTDAITDRYIRLNATGGQHGYAYTNLSGAWTTGRLKIFAAGSYHRSDGYKPNTDFKNWNGYVRARYDSPKLGMLDFQAGAQQRDFGANGFYSLKYPDQFEHTSTALTSLRWLKQSGAWEFSASASYRYNTDRFELIRGDTSVVPFNYHVTDNYGAEAWIARSWNWGKTTLGADWTANHILSTVLGEKLDTPREGPGGVLYGKEKFRNTGNFWLRHSKQWEHWSLALSGGASVHDYGTSGTGSAELSYYPASGLKIFAGAVQSMQLPTFTDLYYTAAGHISNENLVPEKAFMTRIGASYDLGKLHFSTEEYWRRGSDIIDWIMRDGEDVWRSMQITKMNTLGAEFTAAYLQREGFLREASLSYGHIHSDKSSGDDISRYALDYMRNKLSGRLTGALPWGLSLSLCGTLFDRAWDLDPYFLLDGRLSWEKGMLKIYADATNMTATKYFDHTGLEMPSVWVNLGVIVTISQK